MPSPDVRATARQRDVPEFNPLSLNPATQNHPLKKQFPISSVARCFSPRSIQNPIDEPLPCFTMDAGFSQIVVCVLTSVSCRSKM